MEWKTKYHKIANYTNGNLQQLYCEIRFLLPHASNIQDIYAREIKKLNELIYNQKVKGKIN